MQGFVMVLFALSLKYKSDICHILDTQQYVSGIVCSRCLFSWCFVDLQLSVLRLGPCTLCMKHKCSQRAPACFAEGMFFPPESVTKKYKIFKAKQTSKQKTQCICTSHRAEILCEYHRLPKASS